MNKEKVYVSTLKKKTIKLMDYGLHQILNICGLHQINVMEISRNQHAFTRNLKERLKELYEEKWEIESKKKDGKLSFY